MKAAVEELVRVYRASLLLADAPAVDPTRDTVSQGKGGHGKHGTTTTTPGFGADLPLAVEMERALERFVTVYRRRLEAEAQGATATVPNGDTRSAARKAETKAILAEVDRDPTEVAYLYGRTTEAVRKLRQRSGLDPETGQRVPKDLLTAPPPRTSPLSPTTTTED